MPLTDTQDDLAARFETERPRLRSLAYRMLGSFAEAEDVVQEAWLRLARTDAATIESLPAWLTTVVSRVCLDLLRRRATHPETGFGLAVPEPWAGQHAEPGEPGTLFELHDDVGLALLVVLDTLTPAERLAFVLHDLFGLPFDEVGAVAGRSRGAAKMLASRARRRVRGAVVSGGVSLTRQRDVVHAFIAASRGGDLAALVRLLDPDVAPEVRLPGGRTVSVDGAADVATRAVHFGAQDTASRPVLLDGRVGLITTRSDRLIALLRLAIGEHGIERIDLTTAGAGATAYGRLLDA